MFTAPVTDVTTVQNQVRTRPISQDIMGRDDFLHILITQLKNQDPLEPMDQKDTIAQLTQFNMLDQLNGIGDAIDEGQLNMSENMALLANLQKSLIDAQTVGLVGREIRAPRDTVRLDGTNQPNFHFDVPEGVANVEVNVYDSDGYLVRTEDLGQVAGEQTYQLANDGLPAGAYKIEVIAESAGGATDPLLTQLTGLVSGIHYSVEGVLLEVAGQGVSLAEVSYVQAAS